MSVKDVTEIDIQHAILELMKDRRLWSNADLKSELRRVLPWSNADLSRAPQRPNEYRWENRVNNALSPSRPSSLHSKGHVENVGHGVHRVTELGYLFITDALPLDQG